ncbi:HNH endonuclease [Vreelandella venusta]|uniref:HNH endonuclease n=1 Tax=Vreelandella venusta TaxID=44935 RepID=UPI003F67EF86
MPARTPTPCRDKLCRRTTRNAHGYCDEHADQAKAWSRGRAGSGRGGRPWRRLRAKILERDRYLCRCDECKAEGRVTPANEVEHRVPRFEGGTDAPSNLYAINGDCHKRKTQRESLRARQRGG